MTMQYTLLSCRLRFLLKFLAVESFTFMFIQALRVPTKIAIEPLYKDSTV